MSEALTRDAELTAQAVAELVVKAATFGKPHAKALRALIKLEQSAMRAADDCRSFSNVYPIRGADWKAAPRAEAYDAARAARRTVADLLAEAAAAERKRLSWTLRADR